MSLLDRLFGLDLKDQKKNKETLEVFDLDQDSSSEGVTTEDSIGANSFGISTFSLDMQGIVPSDEAELIKKYRELASMAEVDEALQEIRNEIFVYDVPGERAFNLAFSDGEDSPPASIQKKIEQEFKDLYRVIDFQNRGPQYFDSWFIDSKLYLHKVIDKKNPKAGIKKVVSIDPMKIRKIRQVPKLSDQGTFDLNAIKEFYIFADNFDSKFSMNNMYTEVSANTNLKGLQINKDAITFLNSGLYDRSLERYVGYLKKAILPFNNLRMMEDAMLIFRVVRAPQRRAIYVDVSSMQKGKADAYMRKLQTRFKSKMVYDSRTGLLADKKNIRSMMEDYWLPRRENGRTTEIQTLQGQDSQNALEEVKYYRDKFWRSLNVPMSRFGEQSSQNFLVFAQSSQIQRDEYRFKKFLDHLRNHFMGAIEDLLRTQLILRKIITPEDWPDIKKSFFWNFTEDNTFVEYKETQLINNRVNILQQMDPFVGKYFSRDYVRRKILRQSTTEIEEEDKQIEKEPDYQSFFNSGPEDNGPPAEQ